jgi:hypothetical protein
MSPRVTAFERFLALAHAKSHAPRAARFGTNIDGGMVDNLIQERIFSMKNVTAFIAMFVLITSSSALQAQGRGNGQVNKPQTPAHTTGKPASTPSAPKSHPATPKGNGTGNPHETPTTTTTTTTTTVTTTTPTTVKNPQLEQRLQALLPAGMNVTDAAKGFKNWGQFVAAVHVSNNLNIPFTSLKAKVTGPTPMSLGQAIQSLRPAGSTTTTTAVETEVHKAETEADKDLRDARNDHRR